MFRFLSKVLSATFLVLSVLLLPLLATSTQAVTINTATKSASLSASKSAKTTPPAAVVEETVETENLFANPLVLGIIAAIVLGLVGLVAWMMMKKKKPEDKPAALAAEKPTSPPTDTPSSS
jgi:hypothetical protein